MTKMLKDDTKLVSEDLNVQVSSEGILLKCSTQRTHAPLRPRPGQSLYMGGRWDQSSSVNKTLIMYS
ncbi:rCG50551, partial [Rattus norvegicus]